MSEDLRIQITELLDSGLATKTVPVPEDQQQFEDIAASLREWDAKDLRGRLVEAGVQNRPHGEDRQKCRECMYYLANQRWCDLPGLDLPVEPHWWCRMWRI